MTTIVTTMIEAISFLLYVPTLMMTMMMTIVQKLRNPLIYLLGLLILLSPLLTQLLIPLHHHPVRLLWSLLLLSYILLTLLYLLTGQLIRHLTPLTPRLHRLQTQPIHHHQPTHQFRRRLWPPHLRMWYHQPSQSQKRQLYLQHHSAAIRRRQCRRIRKWLAAPAS